MSQVKDTTVAVAVDQFPVTAGVPDVDTFAPAWHELHAVLGKECYFARRDMVAEPGNRLLLGVSLGKRHCLLPKLLRAGKHRHAGQSLRAAESPATLRQTGRRHYSTA